MGGGQRAPADDEHIPWSRAPGVATVPPLSQQVTARADQGGPAQTGAGRQPERPIGGAGAKRSQTADGGHGAEKTLSGFCCAISDLKC